MSMALLRHHRLAVPAGWNDILAAVIRPDVEPTEASLRRQFGGQSVSVFSAGRYALTAWLRGLRKRGPVLIPGFGCTILIDAVRAAGLEPRLVDIELDRYGLNPVDLQRKLPGATAVVAVHEFGIPFSAGVVDVVGAEAPLIEDVAIAFGAKRADGRPVGRDGDAVLVSGGLGKPLSSVNFGALVTRTDEQRAVTPEGTGYRSAATLAIARILSTPVVYSLAASLTDLERGREEVYRPSEEGKPPSRFDMAVIARQLAIVDKAIERRRRVADVVLGTFLNHGWRGPEFGRDFPVFGRLPVQCPDGVDRTAAIEEFKDCGIDLSIPGRRSLVGRVAGTDRGELSGVEFAESRLVALTVDPRLQRTDDLVERIDRALGRIGGGRQ